MLRPGDHPWHRLSRRIRHPQYYLRFWCVMVLLLALVTVVAAAVWVGWRALALRPLAADLADDARTFQRQVTTGDADGAAATLGRLRVASAKAHDLTSGPAWAVAAKLPAVGDDVAAARALTGVAAELTEATRPVETALPALAGRKGSTRGRVDLAALRRVTAAMPALSAAVDDGVTELRGIRADGLVPPLADGVEQVRSMLVTAQGPVRGAQPSLEVLTTLLGGNGPRTYVVLLQQDSEARGTGGLVGSFAVIGAKDGEITLKGVDSRFTLDAGAKIPPTSVPEDLQDLWGADLQEWAGLNLSPHFPWTGRLVAAGWAAQQRPKIDGVIAVDQYVVASMLRATGPLAAGGVTVSPQNAVEFLSRGIYARFPDYVDVDRVTGELVAAVFQRVADGSVSPTALAQALRDPVSQRRLLMWSADPEEQRLIESTGFGGTIPDRPGPFAMAVVNNGGGNKLDAYLSTSVAYDPGACTNGVRIGSVTVNLASTAPRDGLPAYVTGTGVNARHGGSTPSTRVLVDVYGPVGATAPNVLVDGKDAEFLAQGTDRNHPVWRVAVPLPPGGRRTVELTVVQPATAQDATAATVLAQPMVNPMRTSVGKLGPCS